MRVKKGVDRRVAVDKTVQGIVDILCRREEGRVLGKTSWSWKDGT